MKTKPLKECMQELFEKDPEFEKYYNKFSMSLFIEHLWHKLRYSFYKIRDRL